MKAGSQLCLWAICCSGRLLALLEPDASEQRKLLIHANNSDCMQSRNLLDAINVLFASTVFFSRAKLQQSGTYFPTIADIRMPIREISLAPLDCRQEAQKGI